MTSDFDQRLAPDQWDKVYRESRFKHIFILILAFGFASLTVYGVTSDLGRGWFGALAFLIVLLALGTFWIVHVRKMRELSLPGNWVLAIKDNSISLQCFPDPEHAEGLVILLRQDVLSVNRLVLKRQYAWDGITSDSCDALLLKLSASSQEEVRAKLRLRFPRYASECEKTPASLWRRSNLAVWNDDSICIPWRASALDIVPHIENAANDLSGGQSVAIVESTATLLTANSEDEFWEGIQRCLQLGDLSVAATSLEERFHIKWRTANRLVQKMEEHVVVGEMIPDELKRISSGT